MSLIHPQRPPVWLSLHSANSSSPATQTVPQCMPRWAKTVNAQATAFCKCDALPAPWQPRYGPFYPNMHVTYRTCPPQQFQPPASPDASQAACTGRVHRPDPCSFASLTFTFCVRLDVVQPNRALAASPPRDRRCRTLVRQACRCSSTSVIMSDPHRIHEPVACAPQKRVGECNAHARYGHVVTDGVDSTVCVYMHLVLTRLLCIAAATSLPASSEGRRLFSSFVRPLRDALSAYGSPSCFVTSPLADPRAAWAKHTTSPSAS